MFTVVAICDLENVSFGTYKSQQEAESIVNCIDDYQLPDRCIDIVIHNGSMNTFLVKDYV